MCAQQIGIIKSSVLHHTVYLKQSLKKYASADPTPNFYDGKLEVNFTICGDNSVF